jgi:hypothetical protein
LELELGAGDEKIQGEEGDEVEDRVGEEGWEDRVKGVRGRVSTSDMKR